MPTDAIWSTVGNLRMPALAVVSALLALSLLGGGRRNAGKASYPFTRRAGLFSKTAATR